MFKNKNFEGIYYSRFIASWHNVNGELSNRSSWQFEDWLRSLTINDKKIPDDIIREIVELGTNGKMELEHSAYEFIKGKA